VCPDATADQSPVDALRALWPLASREIIRRRLREVGYMQTGVPSLSS
jgi:hypothetical protein